MTGLIEYAKEFASFVGLLVLLAGAFGLMVMIVEVVR